MGYLTNDKIRPSGNRKWMAAIAHACIAILVLWPGSIQSQEHRKSVSLNDDWLTIATDAVTSTADIKTMPVVNSQWKQVDVPHNWDAYEGYRRLVHGNRHGTAWYLKTFTVKESKAGNKFFLFFEGVGSYATVYLNGKYAGEHAGGRTTFTLDVSHLVKTDGNENKLVVRAHHPPGIRDLPWVCGGCSEERGFSEGSQPLGIFRPVRFIVTSDVRIEPFGVHAWAEVNDAVYSLRINTTVKNYSAARRAISVLHRLVDAGGNTVVELRRDTVVAPGDSLQLFAQQRIDSFPLIKAWSPSDPYLYQVVTDIIESGKVIDREKTDFGFRTLKWDTPANQFVINGEPLWINGVAEYEHLLGQSHAFTPEQVESRMKWLKMAGFNAFRDAHQPHNLLYGKLCNQMGVLWWTQLSAHIWFDTPEFRDNFKKKLKQWVIERRNDPSVIMWGLQNESKLPEDFARECTELIRSLDPTASIQRPVTTCNGGSGTDWDVPQNWTGTYGGDPATYASDVKKQVLIGEYGAWRTLDLHSEGKYEQNGPVSEDRMTLLMEQKVRLAESVKDSAAGHYFWLLTSHDNPGRVQGGEGLREPDRVGPVNYKGLLTPWEEPLDVFYMYRSNYVPASKDPMVYIVSHTWPGRWTSPGMKDSIIVYSNCDEVELFNDVEALSLGKRKRGGVGTHFQWDAVPVRYNVLFAVGYVAGKPVARDTIILHHLPQAPGFSKLLSGASITRPQPGYNYIYRINCGGPGYVDENNNVWMADVPRIPGGRTWGSNSWTNDFAGMPPFFASQRRTFDPVKGSNDWKLFQDFRYGRDKLYYEFPLPDGEYLVELYFIEPWLGRGGMVNAEKMRVFDIAVNGKTVIHDLDIWREAGTNTALRKTIVARVKAGMLRISFPRIRAGQAVISAIAIASTKNGIRRAPASGLVSGMKSMTVEYRNWLDIGDNQYSDAGIQIRSLPPVLFGADWLRFSTKGNPDQVRMKANRDVDLYIAISDSLLQRSIVKGFENTSTQIETGEDDSKIYFVYRKQVKHNEWLTAPRGKGYLCMFVPSTLMQPAYDLKPVTSYRTPVAVLSNGVQKEMFASRECAVIKSSERVTLEWPVRTGVADLYSITVKYHYPANREVRGRLQLIGAGNSMMLDEAVKFTFTRTGKWNQFTLNTGSMINAGHYTVKLIVDDAAGLAVSGIEIQ